jgi:hypothetical protein
VAGERIVLHMNSTPTHRVNFPSLRAGSRSFAFLVGSASLPLLLLVCGAAEASRQFRPGAVWTDQNGAAINAHGGGMLVRDGTYYWYGENKEGRTWLPKVNKKWDGYRADITGIRCYASRDLHAWKDAGLVLRPVPDDPAHDLHPSKAAERPKVAFNAQTGKFVMWLHIDTLDYQAARAGVAVADSPAGPFHYLGSVKPEGADSRDQTLFVDDDGKAYRIYSSQGNKTTYISLLTDDYLQHTGKYVKAFVGRKMEAQVVFKRGGAVLVHRVGLHRLGPQRGAIGGGGFDLGTLERAGESVCGPEPAHDLPGAERLRVSRGGQTRRLHLHGRPMEQDESAGFALRVAPCPIRGRWPAARMVERLGPFGLRWPGSSLRLSACRVADPQLRTELRRDPRAV